MKNFLLTIFLFVGLFQTSGQSLSYDDFKELIPYLVSEDWKSAFKQSGILLKSAGKDTSEFRAIILYINILSAAGMVTEGQMSYKELKKNVLKYKGQKIIMSAHPVTTKEGALNQIKFYDSDSTKTAFTAATNIEGVNILCFEKFTFKEGINLDLFPEKSIVRCGGTLENIETNPNESLIWILRLTVTDAFARKAN